ncbi:succinate-semialdehyde dehydrogenase/glutarate-semialdehyde dehydrogenase [Mumia flava]|uniref:Succinate-semialdehyde dehydrogenase/glutarate-semialdehyde dehydrogenase n=1 Tax=Mumia flava TaxID=1348852 RepID=A0A2M9BHR9_9ACTN|nr:NAD-dependent succinate-semialdehyde dehydrogenase [Mumia flava]PJJ57493.1 succinate-semialdehyde dehydrogenase/glutarate-semialdehyde dehydrogenase [Mumia flava]
MTATVDTTDLSALLAGVPDVRTDAALAGTDPGEGWFAVTDPATGAVLAHVAEHDVTDARVAAAAAATAGRDWARRPNRERSAILHRAHALMMDDHERLATLITAENGKTLADARAEVAYAAEFFRWFAEEAVRPHGSYDPAPAGGVRHLVHRKPIGVAALVTPWNFPAAMATRKIAPALAAGCTVVLKPAEETPLTALAVGAILVEAGVPADAVRIVTTTDAPAVVEALLADEHVRKVSFTGSTQVGRILLHQAADRVLESSMELGGNAPFVVCDDADLDAAVAGALTAKLRGGGQVCVAANRFYVHTDVADAFVQRFGEAIAALNVGHGADDGTDAGPVITPVAAERIEKLVADAVAGGARVAYQAQAPSGAGNWVAPRLLVDVPGDAAIAHEEIFGPVATVRTWSDDDEVVAMANDTEFGLASYVYSRDLQRAIRLGEAFESGMVGVNRGLVSDPAAPFGGVKQSGLGREGATLGIDAFTEVQHLAVAWPDA